MQQSVQGNKLGYQQTCLSKFLLAREDVSRQGLLRELAEIKAGDLGVCESPGSPLIDWCEIMVKRAIHQSLGPDSVDVKNSRFTGKVPARGLPEQIIHALVDRSLDTLCDMGVLDRESPKDDQDSGRNSRESRVRRKPSDEEIKIIRPEPDPSRCLALQRSMSLVAKSHSVEEPGEGTAPETKIKGVSASGEVSKQTGTFDAANGKVDDVEAVNREKQPTVSITLDDGNNGKTHENEDDETRKNKSQSKGKDDNNRLSTPPSKCLEMYPLERSPVVDN